MSVGIDKKMQECVRLDAELLATRRAMLDDAPDRTALEEKAEGTRERLDELGFAEMTFPPDSQIYRQSFWKYFELFGKFVAEDKVLTKEEADTLYSIAFESSNEGIKYFFRSLVSERPFAMRWGGFGEPTDDRDVSKFAGSGGIVLNFARSSEPVYANKPGVASYGYDPLSTVNVPPFGLKWQDPEDQLSMKDASSVWLISETPRDMSELGGARPELFLFESGSAKRTILEGRMNVLKSNIENISLFEENVAFIFNSILSPSAAMYAMMSLIVEVLSAKTIDVATKYLYITMIQRGMKEFDERMIELGAKIGATGMLSDELRHTMALAVKQDVVAVAGIIPPSAKFLEQLLIKDVVPRSILAAHGSTMCDTLRLMQTWEGEGPEHSTMKERDRDLVERFIRSDDNIALSDMRKNAIDRILFEAKQLVLPLSKRGVSDFNSMIFEFSMAGGGVLAMLAAHGVPETGAVTALASFFGKMAGYGAWVTALGQQIYSGTTIMTNGPDELLKKIREGIQSEYRINSKGECAIEFKGEE